MNFKMNLSTAIITCTILAGVFALTVAILQLIKQRGDERNNTKVAQANEKKQIEISDLQAKLLERSDSFIDGQEKVIALQNELNQKNNKIQELQNETLNNLTGGSGIPKVFLVSGHQY
jgi:uncharacterized protein HemX